MDFLPGISNALAKFSYKTALNFFSETPKNSVFSPYSLFLALFLSSALNPEVSPRILKHLNFPNPEIPPGDQIKQLRFFSKSVETVPSIPKYINSTSFNRFISKFDLTDDQQFISYIILNKLIKRIKFDDMLTKEAKIASFLKKIDEDSGDTVLNKKAHKYKKFVEENVKKYPLIIGSNYLFMNKKTNFTIPIPISKKYRNFIIKTDFPELGYKVINKFIKNSTRGLITNFISASDLPANSLYFIANTLYFKSVWKHKFELLESKKIFTTIDGDEEKMEFMKSKDDFYYYENDDLLYINLEYYKCSFSFELIMPKKMKRINSIRRQLFEDNLLDKISKEAASSKVILAMPKFTLKTDLMNFDKVLNIHGTDSILQKAVIIVDEKGTEAAAATGVVSRGINIDRPIEVIIDQPFIFVIRDIKKNIPLFIGEFVNPPSE